MATANARPRMSSPDQRPDRPAVPALEEEPPALAPARWSLPAAARPVLVWIAATALAESLAGGTVIPELAIAGVGGLIAAATVGRLARPLAVLSMLPAALAPDAPLWAWIVGASALALAVGSAGRSAAVSVRDDLRRQLARARRRREEAALLLVTADAATVTADGLRSRLRWTDSAEIARHDGELELHCLFDAAGLDRRAVERRVRAAAGRPVALGWATFPEDGLTLEALLDAARGRLGAGRALRDDVAPHGEQAQQVAQSTYPGG